MLVPFLRQFGWSKKVKKLDRFRFRPKKKCPPCRPPPVPHTHSLIRRSGGLPQRNRRLWWALCVHIGRLRQKGKTRSPTTYSARVGKRAWPRPSRRLRTPWTTVSTEDERERGAKHRGGGRSVIDGRDCLALAPACGTQKTMTAEPRLLPLRKNENYSTF